MTAVELLQHGFAVNWPTLDVGYDLISDDGMGSVKRIQVKTAQKNKGGTYFVYFSKGRLKKSLYTKSDADFFSVYLNYGGQPAFYIIPVEEVLSQKGIFWPAGQHPRYPEKWKACKYETYRSRWDLLR
tara:strand:- start:2153 stop:2536 length:384 start_codon:yes stop_codon:yes gene_type:complete